MLALTSVYSETAGLTGGVLRSLTSQPITARAAPSWVAGHSQHLGGGLFFVAEGVTCYVVDD